jgi:hypothetical protein
MATSVSEEVEEASSTTKFMGDFFKDFLVGVVKEKASIAAAAYFYG